MKRFALSILSLAACSTGAFAEPPAQSVHMPVERTVKLTDAEIDVTIQMLDECVKAKGLLCAEAATVMARKLRATQHPETPKALPPKK
jgi:hypothetical protein